MDRSIDIALDLRVECVADREDPAPGAAQGDRLVQWQDFPKQLSGLPIGQMGGPLPMSTESGVDSGHVRPFPAQKRTFLRASRHMYENAQTKCMEAS